MATAESGRIVQEPPGSSSGGLPGSLPCKGVGPEHRRRRVRLPVQLLQEYPELDVERLRQLVGRAGSSGDRRVEPIRPKSASELVALVEAGILSKAEAAVPCSSRLRRARRGELRAGKRREDEMAATWMNHVS